MNSETQAQVPVAAARALANHLRANPGDATLSSTELGSRFQLPPSFVEAVLQGVRQPQTREKARQPRVSPLVNLWRDLRWIGHKLTNRPTLFVLVSTLLPCLMVLGFNLYSASHPGFMHRTPAAGWSLLLTALLVSLLQFAVYFRHARARYAVIGGGIYYLLFSSLLGFLTVREGVPSDFPDPVQYYSLAFVGIFFMCATYSAFGAGFALAGGYYRLRSSDRAMERMSRQELLERYYELQSRLEPYPRSSEERRGLFDSPVLKDFRRNPFLFSFLASIVLHLIYVGVIGSMTKGITILGANAPPLAVMLSGLIGILLIIVAIALAYASKGFWLALAVTTVFFLAGIPVQFLPIGVFGPHFMENNMKPFHWVFMFCEVFFIALGASVGGMIEERAARDRKIQQNDPATVLAEMVRIQWRLSTDTSTVCVMVVDASKSSEMKAMSDPLDVEYSFREYQDWLEDIVRQHSGHVYSTAGDGAVIYFSDPENAFDAARVIQSDVNRFNTEVNRLAKPFRLRIGLHLGSVAGRLEDVEFTEVIDIAAHVEERCTVGGVAVTQEVANCLHYANFIPLMEPVDDHVVLLAANPTV